MTMLVGAIFLCQVSRIEDSCGLEGHVCKKVCECGGYLYYEQQNALI